MGRDDRERRRASEERLQAAGITPRKRGGAGRGLAVGAVVLVLALAAGLYVYWQNSGGESAEPTYPVARAGTVVTAGNPSAGVIVDVYEDYLCPACQQFERIYGPELTTALNEGKVKVNYHTVSILDERTNPPGYSTLAGNAALCAVDAGVWPRFHARLYAEQPTEGGPGKTAGDLVAIGSELGARGDFAGCVNRLGEGAAVRAATTEAAANPVVAPGGRFATPTVLLNGAKIDVNDSEWLSRAVGG